LRKAHRIIHVGGRQDGACAVGNCLDNGTSRAQHIDDRDNATGEGTIG
jgi:hypothetical protein